MRLAMRGEIGSAAGQVEVFDEQDLIRDLEANGIDTLYWHVLDLYGESIEFRDRFQIAWSAQGTANLECSPREERPVTPGK